MLRGQTVLSREGLVYLALTVFIFAGGLIRDINLPMVLSGLMLGPLLFNWRAVKKTLRGLTIRRRLPEGIAAGDELTVGLEVTNGRRRGASWGLVIEDTVVLETSGAAPADAAPGAAGQATIARTMITRVAAGETRRASYRGRLPRRGRYRFGPLRVTTRFPMGLARRTLRVEQPATLVVFPRLGRLTAQWARRAQQAADGSRAVERPQGMREGDYHGLRDFRGGDSRRWIHWRTSARRGELMVKQFEQQRNQDLLLVAELWQPEQPGAEDLARVETAVSLAATLAADRCREKAGFVQLTLAAHEQSQIGGPASAALMRDALNRLALCNATSRDALPAALDAALTQSRPEARLVLVVTRPVDLSDARRFAAIYRDPRKRGWLGRTLVLDVSSPKLGEWLEEDPATGG